MGKEGKGNRRQAEDAAVEFDRSAEEEFSDAATPGLKEITRIDRSRAKADAALENPVTQAEIRQFERIDALLPAADDQDGDLPQKARNERAEGRKAAFARNGGKEITTDSDGAGKRHVKLRGALAAAAADDVVDLGVQTPKDPVGMIDPKRGRKIKGGTRSLDA